MEGVGNEIVHKFKINQAFPRICLSSKYVPVIFFQTQIILSFNQNDQAAAEAAAAAQWSQQPKPRYVDFNARFRI